MADSKAPMTLKAKHIVDVYQSVITTVQGTIKSEETVVDVDLLFRDISITEKGFLVFSKQNKSTTELRLVTRVRKPQD
ncbi:MAG: hypothetical protein AAFR38_06445 [Planctomycetota bacterium]